MISVWDPLSSHLYYHQKVKLEKKRIRLMNSVGSVSMQRKMKKDGEHLFSAIQIFPCSFQFFKSTLLLGLNLEYALWSWGCWNKYLTSMVHASSWRLRSFLLLLCMSYFSKYYHIQIFVGEKTNYFVFN